MPQTTTIDSAADLQAALRTAAKGDTLLLSTGHYGSLALGHATPSKYAPASGLTIRSLDSAAPAVFNTLNIHGVTQLTLDGLVFEGDDVPQADSPASDAEFPFHLSHCTDITLCNTVFKGTLGPSTPRLPAQFGIGLVIHQCTGVHLLHNTISCFKRGLVIAGSQNLTLSQNRIHTIGVAGIECANLRNALIQGNHLFDFWHSAELIEPPVMIRFFANKSQKPSQAITLRDNWLEMGQGAPSRSILVVAKETPGTSALSTACEDLTLVGNMIVNRDFHGLQIDRVETLRLDRNIVLQSVSKEGVPSEACDIPRIMIDPASSNVIAQRNVTAALDGFEGQVTWKVSHTGRVPYATPALAHRCIKALIGAALACPEGSPRFAVKRAGLSAPRGAPSAVTPHPIQQKNLASAPRRKPATTVKTADVYKPKQRPHKGHPVRSSSLWINTQKKTATHRVRLGQGDDHSQLSWAVISNLIQSQSYRIDMTAKMLPVTYPRDIIHLPGSFVVRLNSAGNLKADVFDQYDQIGHLTSKHVKLSDQQEHRVSFLVAQYLVTLEVDGVRCAQHTLQAPMHFTQEDDLLFPYQGLLGFAQVTHQTPLPAADPALGSVDQHSDLILTTKATDGLGDRFEFLT